MAVEAAMVLQQVRAARVVRLRFHPMPVLLTPVTLTKERSVLMVERARVPATAIVVAPAPARKVPEGKVAPAVREQPVGQPDP